MSRAGGKGPKPQTKQRSIWHEREDAAPFLVAGSTIYQRNVHDGHLLAFVSPEPRGLHLSISHRTNGDPPRPGRYPTWDELTDARYALLPSDLDFVMHLPPADEYVAVHDTTFHLHQHPPLEGP